VLGAFANVANVLAALELDAETPRAALCRTDRRAKLEITQEQFQAGAIAPRRTYQQVRIALVIAQANRFASTVALFQSLVDGWWNRQDVVQVSEARTAPM
jgi:outer membrane protein TolC